MIVVSEGLGAITTEAQHHSLRRLLAESFHCDPDDILPTMRNARQYFFFKKNKPVAVATFRERGHLRYYDTVRANVLCNAATSPTHRRKGHMRALLGRLIDDLRKEKKRHLNLNARTDNPGAMRLYASLGFEVVCAFGSIVHMRLRL
jgi:predicted GNAT family acetyltransferase